MSHPQPDSQPPAGAGPASGSDRAVAEADRHIQRGVELLAAGAAGAQEALEQAVELAPTDPGILVRAAALSFNNEQFERARELLALATQRATPEFGLMPWLAHLGGRLAARDGLRDVALQLLGLAFDAYPGEQSFGYALAEELLRAGRYQEARDTVSAALEAGAQDAELPRLSGEAEAIATAEAEYARARDAGEPKALGIAALRLGESVEPYDPARARSAFEETLATPDPTGRAMASLNLGALLSKSDPAGAQRHYETAIAGEDPLISAAAAFNLAGLLMRSDPVQARGLYELACASPDGSLAEMARIQLAVLG